MASSAAKREATVWVDDASIDPARWFVLSRDPEQSVVSASVASWQMAGAGVATFATATFATPLVSVVPVTARQLTRDIPPGIIHRLPRRAAGVHSLPQRSGVRVRSGAVRRQASKAAPRRTEQTVRRKAFAVLIAAVVGLWGTLVVSTGGMKSQTRAQTSAQPADDGFAPR